MKIFCIGRNYAKHAAEMNSAVPEEPMIFMKPETAFHAPNGTYLLPKFSEDFHYEAEVLLRIKRTVRKEVITDVKMVVDGIGIGIDFTARDVQRKCKAKGHPWEIAKSFDGSAVVSAFHDIEKFDTNNIKFSLAKNGIIVQSGQTCDLIFNFETLITHISQYFTLNKGDIIFTGTPEGIGPVTNGDILEGRLGENLLIELKII